MNKDTRNKIILTAVGIIIVLIIVIFIIVKSQENKEMENSFRGIGQAASDYIKDIETANSHINDFSYNYETGEVDYHPTITLEMYDRIKEGMTKEKVVSILGKEDNIIKNNDSNSYIVEYGESYLTKGYWVQIVVDKSTDKVMKKYQTGLK